MHREFMNMALSLAKMAAEQGEVPVGAVIVKDGAVIAQGYNKRESERNALCHAEIEAINKACKALSGWRLEDCTLYVTLEPCLMCTGAIVNSRISRVIFGAYDETDGFLSLKKGFLPEGADLSVTGGYLEKECSEILSNFFSRKRKNTSL